MRFRENRSNFKLTWLTYVNKMEHIYYQQLTSNFDLVLIIVEKPTKLCSNLG